jgi:hypothetical protein
LILIIEDNEKNRMLVRVPLAASVRTLQLDCLYTLADKPYRIGVNRGDRGSVNRKEAFMASYMLIRHKVRDFSEWKRGYDAHLPKRVEAGLTEKHLLRGAQEPNEVILLFEAKDLNRAKTFAESTDLKETMQKVGVVDKPDIYFVNG